MVLGKNFKVYFKPADEQRPFSLLIDNRSLNGGLFFESGVITTLSNSIVHISEAYLDGSFCDLAPDEVDHLRPLHNKAFDAYAILGILTHNSGAGTVLYLIVVNSYASVGKLPVAKGAETEVLKITGVQAVSLRNAPGDEERLAELVKLFSSGIFYFASSTNSNVPPLDLTVCAQRASFCAPTDNRFLWNRGLHLYMQSFGVPCDKWLAKIICGGVEIKTVYVDKYQARACVISRFNCYRAGTRFQVRGVNDDGNVANFVETEQLICFGDQTTSFIQIRGSVPLFWEQTGVQVGTHRVTFSRSFETMSPAFERHLNMIQREYGDQVLINLLGNREGETNLSEAFQSLVERSPYHRGMLYIHFDYHANVRGGRTEVLASQLEGKISPKLKEFGFFHCTDNNGVLRQQIGTVRTNCLDCLDRTNAVQTFIGLLLLPDQLTASGFGDKPQVLSKFVQAFTLLWQQNGDHISQIYAGTGALDGKSMLKDGAKSVSRTLQNNLFDSSKQEAIDILLTGALLNSDCADRARTVLPFNLRQVPSFLLNALFDQAEKFTDEVPLKFWIGTWNVNGGKNVKTAFNKDRPIEDWLLDCTMISRQNETNYLVPSWDCDEPIDVFAVGFEEIVDLSASNILTASTTNQQQWCADILAAINRDPSRRYVLVNSLQLVGVCLFVFVLVKHVPYLRDVATAMVKTGLGGATGNKGGVAIRFQLYNSSLCFCCSHFAAGQSNYNERNEDFLEISKKLVFPAGLAPHSHDFIFWCGDFNYRIDMPIDNVKAFIAEKNWPALAEGDQLINNKTQGKVFKEFTEAPILFAPTYKYDLFSDIYDTSEKCRCPAWTDRVLVRGRRYGDLDWNKYEIYYYGRSELKSSDHRPVSALVSVNIHTTDHHRCEEVLEDIMNNMGPSDATVLISLDDINALYEPSVYAAIIGVLYPLGKILLTRYSGSDICVTFSTGVSALSALSCNGTDILGHQLHVRLKTEDWKGVLDKLVELSKNTATPLFDNGEPLLLDENELSLHIPYSNPVVTAGGLDDLAILTGEDGNFESTFAGSLTNMALSEVAEADTASLHSSNSDGGTTPSVGPQKCSLQKVPPARPPQPKPMKPPPPRVKETIDPWHVPEDSPKLIEIAAPTLVPVHKEVLVAAAPRPNGFDIPFDQTFVSHENTQQPVRTSPDIPVSKSLSPAGPAPPPPPPPRRQVGQKLPDVLLKR